MIDSNDTVVVDRSTRHVEMRSAVRPFVQRHFAFLLDECVTRRPSLHPHFETFDDKVRLGAGINGDCGLRVER